tara:strand:+ start:3024 stop:3239 length:216 start_codon:yes stop_codon:yes gene_type:complete
MTWNPFWNTTNKVLIAPVVIPTLSYGLYYFITHTQKPDYNQISEQEEMKRWSNTLSDPSHKNYNPFTFNQK